MITERRRADDPPPWAGRTFAASRDDLGHHRETGDSACCGKDVGTDRGADVLGEGGITIALSREGLSIDGDATTPFEPLATFVLLRVLLLLQVSGVETQARQVQ